MTDEQIIVLLCGMFFLGFPSFLYFSLKNATIKDLLEDTVKDLSNTKVALETAFATAPEAKKIYTITKAALDAQPHEEK